MVERELRAIKLGHEGDSRGTLHRIPAQSNVTVVRPSALPGMLEIKWQGESYAVFEIDLTERCAPVSSRPRFWVWPKFG
jgi:hypothetical protein